MEVPKDCSLADDFLRSAGIERTIAARGLCFFLGGGGLCFKGHANECPAMQSESLDLAPFSYLFWRCPGDLLFLFWFLLFCLSSWNSGSTMVFSSFSHPALQTWDSEDSLQRKQLGTEGFLFAPSVNHFRTMPIVFTCRLGLVQRFLKRKAIGSLWFICVSAAT